MNTDQPDTFATNGWTDNQMNLTIVVPVRNEELSYPTIGENRPNRPVRLS